jgi:hypothetical protein
MFSMNDLEVQKLLKLLDQAIHESRRSRRDIERSLGLGQGYLSSLFRGRIELKVWHVYRLARELGHDPLKFFFKVSPPQDTRWVREQIGPLLAPLGPLASLAPAPVRAKEPEKAPPPVIPSPEALVTRGELDALVRRTIRDELWRMKDKEPAEPPEPPDDFEEPEDSHDPDEP